MRDTFSSACSAARLLPINFLGCAAFGLSVAAMALVRLAVPDDVMTQPSPVLSEAANIIVGVYTCAWLIWVWIYFRTADSFLLTAFGAAWSAIGLVALAVELVMRQQHSLLPTFAGFLLFFLFLFVHAVWLKRNER